jgi:hypothetical protein
MEMPAQEINSQNFVNDLSNRIDMTVEAKHIVFAGLASNPVRRQLFIIFALT